MNILVTGATGYIGSHTIVELLKEGHKVFGIDNLSNSNIEVINRIKIITGKEIPFVKVDIRNRDELEKVVKNNNFDSCIHFAGLKAVGESISKAWEYYDNNINGTLTLLDVLKKNNCKKFVFSSSATVYGNPKEIPITENCPKDRCTNPYGWTKSMIEEILFDVYKSDIKNNESNPWKIVILRYFNPIGAHESGLIGEDPNGVPNNLMPYITQVAMKKLEKLHIFGNDYDTVDGTGVRDYIHVVDLAKGHIKALSAIKDDFGVEVFNLGTGKGYSVLEIVKAFEKASGVSIPYVFDSRRDGDIATCFSNPQKAYEKLGWKAKFGIEEMCRDSWNWQKKNPNGYKNYF